MLNAKPLSQRNPRWALKKLGFSNYTIGGKGCTLTALTSLVNFTYNFDLTPDQLNDQLKKFEAFAEDKHGEKALVIWSRVSLAYPKLKWVYRDYKYSNTKVAWYIYVHKIPVMVEVNAWSIGAPRHWVLYCGGQLMIDPWTGSIRSTAVYPATGDALYQYR